MVTNSDVDPLWVFSDWRTEYVSDGRTLTGFFVAPDGDGPFPGVVFHHGSNGLMAEAKLGLLELVGMGYAVFVPIRRGHNGNPGPFWETLVTEPWGSEAMGPQLVSALARECDDTLAALEWIKDQAIVYPERVAMLGSSYGGVGEAARDTDLPTARHRAWHRPWRLQTKGSTCGRQMCDAFWPTGCRPPLYPPSCDHRIGR